MLLKKISDSKLTNKNVIKKENIEIMRIMKVKKIYIMMCNRSKIK